LSANGDGQNDFFLIDCLDQFENNRVEIFNRDGTRVFEMDGYNNLDRRFEGFSNIGAGTRQLPTGTYFYVIDKGDGSEFINGYLELVR
jgi:gliding motility-associated-like protein